MVVLKELFKLYYSEKKNILKASRREFLKSVIQYCEIKIPKEVVHVLRYGYTSYKSTDRVKIIYWAKKFQFTEEFYNAIVGDDDLIFIFYKDKFLEEHGIQIDFDTFSRVFNLEVEPVDLTEQDINNLSSVDLMEIIKLLVPYSKSYRDSLLEMYQKEIYYLKCVFNDKVKDEETKIKLRGIL